MEQSKREFLPVLQSVKLSKTQNPTTAENRKRMKSHSLCLGHRFYKVCMLFTSPIVYLNIFLAREYNSDLGVDHWTLVKIILSGIRICFSIMEVIKEFVVKSYIDVSFYTDPDHSKSQSGYILKVGAIS